MNASADNSNMAFQLKGSLFILTVLHILSPNISLFAEQITTLVKQTPKFFYRMPIVLDLQKLPQNHQPLDLRGITQCLRDHNIIPVGVRGGNNQQHEAAIAAGLAVLPMTKTEASELKPESSNAKPAAVDNTMITGSKLITQPVRSGQQIYAKQADLIVLAPVSPGAELLADGHIHVYGPLRGRALAGVTGNQNARIFCQTLDAELVSIAGHYWINEDIQNIIQKDNINIYLESERLHIGTL